MDNIEMKALVVELRERSEHQLDYHCDSVSAAVSEVMELAADTLEALLDQPGKQGWQPIETAPKDGTVIFVWHVSRINKYAAMDSNIKKAQQGKAQASAQSRHVVVAPAPTVG